MINEVKELGREELQDEILHILFTYLINENNEKDRMIKNLWNEKKGNYKINMEELENKRLIDELDYKRLIERSTRLNKAINYIESYLIPLFDECDNILKVTNELLDILKGIDKDDRDSNNNDN